MAVFTLNEAMRGVIGGLAVPGNTPARTRDAHRPVRRGSIEAGTFEDRFFSVPARGETDHLLRIARKTLDAGRRLRREARAGDRILTATERAIAALTSAAIRVYEELLSLARLNRGRVFPSYDHLANATGLGRATVARALPILERIGFLVRQRRFKRVQGHDLTPRYAQTSNVYRALLPTRVMPYLPRWMRPAPLPADALQRRDDEVAHHETMLASLSCRDLSAVAVDGAMGRAFAMLGAAIDRHTCESHYDAERSNHFIG